MVLHQTDRGSNQIVSARARLCGVARLFYNSICKAETKEHHSTSHSLEHSSLFITQSACQSQHSLMGEECPIAGWSGNDAAKQTPSSAAAAQQSSSAQSIMASTLPDPNANPLAIQPISTPGLAGSGRWIAPWQSCNPWSPHNSSLNDASPRR